MMELKLNRKNRLPIHTQLKAQLVYLIQSSQLAPGTRLPTVRQLAGFLRVNRNTVSKVFSEMEKEGYLTCESGRGTFVSKPAIKPRRKVEKMQELMRIVDEAVRKAVDLGFSPEEFSLTLFARTQTAEKRTGSPSRQALFVECNHLQTKLFSAELRRELPLRVDPMLVEEVRQTAKADPGTFRKYDLVLTTFYHIHEIQALLAATGTEVVALMVETSLDTLMRLTSLPAGTKVGVACSDWTGSENMRLSIENAGLKHLQLILACGEEKGSVRKMLEEASLVVCSSMAEEKIRALAPRSTEIIMDHRSLGRAGIEMLRSRLADLDSRDRKHAGLSARPQGEAGNSRY
jgi:GntR family transcriptional regulator